MQTARARAISTFRRQFGTEPMLVFRAPGRVNLIGEHTDYNDGFVLPCAIDRDAVVAIGPSADSSTRVVACDLGDATDQFGLDGTITPVAAEWANYVRGMSRIMQEDGLPLVAAHMAIAGDVPLGSGLSSSAALTVAAGTALAALAGHTLDPTRMAQLAQATENIFVGCACGIMDQLISTRATAGQALLIDCRSLDCAAVAIPDDVAIIIAHSGIRHANTDGAYNERRRQCEAAARHYGVAALRDIDEAQLLAGRAGLDAICFRRARHVVTENARTLAAAQALKAGDLARLGELMAQSHASMRDDFEITLPAVDQLAAIMAAPLNGCGGARMTGGGFGGCVVAVAPRAQVPAVLAAIARDYRTPAGAPADVFVCRPSAGAGPA